MEENNFDSINNLAIILGPGPHQKRLSSKLIEAKSIIVSMISLLTAILERRAISQFSGMAPFLTM